MKVDETHNPKGISRRVTSGPSKGQEKPDADGRSPAAPTADRVLLSPRARVCAQARRQLAALPDIDREKVRKIRHRVQTGRYRPDAEKIADRMIRDALNHHE